MAHRLVLVLLVSLLVSSNTHAQVPGKGPLPAGAVARLGTLRFKHEPGNSGRLTNAIYSPDGRKIVSLANLGMEVSNFPVGVCIWDSRSGKREFGPWDAEKRGSNSRAAISSDSRFLAAASMMSEKKGPSYAYTTTIGCFDITESKSLQTLIVEEKVHALAFIDAGKTLISIGTGGLHWWDVATGKLKRLWMPFEKDMSITKSDPKKLVSVSDGIFSRDAKYLAAQLARTERGDDGKLVSSGVTAVVIDIATSKELWRAELSGQTKLPMCFSGDGKRLALAIKPDEMEIRDTANGKVVAIPPLKTALQAKDRIEVVRLSSTGDALAAAGYDRYPEIAFWNSTEPNALRKMSVAGVASASNTKPQIFSFSPDDKNVLVGFGSSLRLYDLKTLQEVNSSPGHNGDVDYLHFTSDTKELVSANATGGMISKEAIRWDAATWKALKSTSLLMSQFSEVGRPSPEHSVYTGKTGEKRFQFFDMANGRMLGRLSDLPKGEPTLGYFSSSAKFYMLEGKDEKGKTAEHLYEVPSGKLLCRLPAMASNNAWARPFTFSADDRLVAMLASEGGQIHVIETATGKVLHRFGQKVQDRPNPTNLAFSWNGKMLASWSAPDGVIRIWDIATGRQSLTIPNLPYKGTMQIAFSPDGRVLAVGSEKIQLLELETLRIRREFTGHKGPITSLAFSPDGRLLTSGSTDTTVLIWDVWGR